MKFVTLEGAKVPALGFGSGGATGPGGRKRIAEALSLGYRHIDTAQMYLNEEEVGGAIKDSSIDRGEIFVTTKIDRSNTAAAAVARSTEESLGKLRTDYIDLLLIHWPVRGADLGETLDAMAKLKRAGKVRHIGVSNFNAKLLVEAVEKHGADLLCNQVEYHVFLSQKTVLATLRRFGMMLTAYAPLAQGNAARDPTILAIAKKHGKTPGQIALRWLIEQENVAAIPKSSTRPHMIENISVFDFELTAEERATINRLGGAGGRQVDPAGWGPGWDKD